MKKYALFAISMTFLISLAYFAPASHAQENPNLYVSAENTSSENHFAGPMVIEVMVDDSDISSLTRSGQEPDVTIDNRKLSMVQADDGKWYGYFADKTQAQKADSLVGLLGDGLDFGKMCSSDSSIAGMDLSDTSGFAIPRDISSGSNGQEAFVTCTGEISSSDQIINNVVRVAPALNTEASTTGQTGIDTNAWPLIQLFDIGPRGDIDIKYKKTSGTQLVNLKFDTVDEFAMITLDKMSYRPGADIKIDISDLILNIDPTDEDSWTWASASDEGGIYYQLFDKDGTNSADGTDGAFNIQVEGNLAAMMFDDSGKFILNPNPYRATNAVTILQDNDYTVLEDKDTTDDTIDLGTDTISHTHYPITFTETAINSGLFVNYDGEDTANLIVNPEAESGESALVTYNKKSLSIIVQSGSPPTALDYSKDVDKDTPVSFTVINNSTDPNGDMLQVTVSGVNELEGSATVGSSNNTITFTPISGFLGTSTFEYMIDDLIDGNDTGTITVTTKSSAIAASINQITVNSDKSTYDVGGTIDADWVIPDDSSGTDTTIEIISPIGTTPISNVLTEGTTYSISETGDFDAGMYTIRVEHGQYYGEKSVTFALPGETDTPTDTEQVTEAIPDSCMADSKISIRLGDTSYAKGDKISVVVELCGVVSDEYVAIQILEPSGNPITIDQILPKTSNFTKEYSTDSKQLKPDVEYTIKSTYLKNTAKLTFELDPPSSSSSSPTTPTAPTTPQETPTVEPVETIAQFVDPDKDPQHYVDRYNNEESYKKWFDTNYDQYDSIYEAVGVDESATPNTPDPSNNIPTTTPETPPRIESKEQTCEAGTELVNGVCQVVGTDEEPTCGAGTELVNGICQVVGTNEKPACGAGTELVNGICQVVGTDEEGSFFENIFGFFKTLFDR